MAEVIAIRTELEELTQTMNLVQEALYIRKELDSLRREIENIQSKWIQLKSEENLSRQRQRELEENERKDKEQREREEKERKDKEQRELEEKNKKSAERNATVSTKKITTSTGSSSMSEIGVQRSQSRQALSKPVAKPASSTTTGPSIATQANPSSSTSDKYIEIRKQQEVDEVDALFRAKTKQPEIPEFQHFGLDAELAKKAKEKYDPKLEQEAKSWIEEVTGEKLTGNSFAQVLKSGVVLCNLINKLKANTIGKINKQNMAFMQMENINSFLAACKNFGVPQSDLFMTVDLFEEKNMNQVILTIHSLGRLSRKIPGYSGPSIGAKLSDKHEVQFTDEQLKKGRSELSFAQANQHETQKLVSDARRPAMDNVVRSKDTGTTIAQVSLLDKPKRDAQKEASSAKKQGHNIIKN